MFCMFKIYFILFYLSFSFCCISQSNTGNFLISNVGLINNFSNNSISILFKNNSESCLNIENGLATINYLKKNYSSSLSCDFKYKINTLGIKLYPNPVNSITTIKFTYQPPQNNLFNIIIFDIEGKMVLNFRDYGNNIFNGKILDLGGLNAGVYFLDIESANYIDSIKFIKSK